MLRFVDWWLLLLIPVVILLFWALQRKRGLKFSSVNLLRIVDDGKSIKHKIGKTLVLCGVVLLLIALARPQTEDQDDAGKRQGIDIAMILDVSGSMGSTDFLPNRLAVAQSTMSDFITARENDRISFIIFAGTAYTRIPLTLDHDVIKDSLTGVSMHSIKETGTAIGTALAVGLSRLRKSESASRIMILLTDGENNIRLIDPLTVGRLSQELGIRIYIIGVGSDIDSAQLPYYSWGRQPWEIEQDKEELRQITETTGGQYFLARDPDALTKVFETIEQLEKTEFEDDSFKEYTEQAFILIKLALFLLLAGIFLDKHHFVRIP